jgi:hypothetical protein
MRLMSEPLNCDSSLSLYCRFASDCLMEVRAALFVHVHVLPVATDYFSIHLLAKINCTIRLAHQRLQVDKTNSKI